MLESSACIAAGKNGFFEFKRVCNLHFMPKLRYPSPFLTLLIAALLVDNGEKIIVKKWNILGGKETKVPIPE